MNNYTNPLKIDLKSIPNRLKIKKIVIQNVIKISPGDVLAASWGVTKESPNLRAPFERFWREKIECFYHFFKNTDCFLGIFGTCTKSVGVQKS